MAYEWVGPDVLTRVGGEQIEPGDTFEPTESELSTFADRITASDAENGTHTAGDDESEADSQDADTDADEPAQADAETETFRCGVNGCSREVESEADTCWQHSED